MTGDNESVGPERESTGEVLWTPSPERIESSKLTAFARRIEAAHGEHFEDYESLWRWSVEHLEDFWAGVWDFFDVAPDTATLARAHLDALADVAADFAEAAETPTLTGFLAYLGAADERVRIPMVGRVNSLNAATAAAVVVYEAVRQRSS